jgi:uncharacterized RDD family membrane protein YckC
MTYVGVGLRFVAVLIDSIIFMVLGWVLALFFGGASATGFQLNGGPAILLFVIGFAYFIVLEAVAGGTLGKLIIGIRVYTVDGQPISWGASIIRNILRIIDGLFFYLVGAILVWTSDRKQRLGDRAAKTVVAKKMS